LSKKKTPFNHLKVNQPAKPNFIPPNVSQQTLGQGQQGQQGLVAVETTLSVSGPIPTPDIIAGYEKVLAGSADRIIKMAEKEQAHRHLCQLRQQSNLARLTLIGQIFAFLMGISGVGGGIYLVRNDKSIAGFGVFFASLAALVGLFFFNQSRPRKTTTEK